MPRRRLGHGQARCAFTANTATDVEKKSMAAAMNAVTAAKEQPLVLVGVGLALGAAVGAALPLTQAENQLLGETADEVKDQATELASEAFDTAKQIASEK